MQPFQIAQQTTTDYAVRQNRVLRNTYALLALSMVPTVLGALLGILISFNLEGIIHRVESLLGTQFLDARVYFMSDLPAFVEWPDVAQVASVAFALCALATVYPAWRASRTAPAEALRHDF